MLLKALVLLVASLRVHVYATQAEIRRDGGPVVSLDYATFEGASADGVESFLGIPYAQPPVGKLRFRRPRPSLPLPGITLATVYGNACFPQDSPLPSIPNIDYSVLSTIAPKANASEICLYANVLRPAGVTEKSKLPVVAWIHGGGFVFGDGSGYDGTTVVERSVQLGEPVIYVNFNYRLNAFGFLAGKEALAGGAANIGIHDQRFFLEWVQMYISKFGGDPHKITVWGQSAGGISIAAHIVTNLVDPPFKAAVMDSGFLYPIYKTDSPKHQAIYDQLVQHTGCSLAPDTLECLRAVPYADLADAVNATPPLLSTNGLDITYAISIDGELIKKSLNQYVDEGYYARIPILGTHVDDEGTLFSLVPPSNSDADVKALLKAHLFPGATDAQVDSVVDQYPKDPAAGSPFDTGNRNVLTPEFKRLAAIQGDYGFGSGRRLAFSKWATTQNVWASLWKRRKDLLYLGSVHVADIAELYGITGDNLAVDAIINFINYDDPNHPKGSKAISLLSNVTWPKYTLSNKEMLLFSDDTAEEYTIISDTYRADAIAAIIELQLDLESSGKTQPAQSTYLNFSVKDWASRISMTFDIFDWY